MPELRKDPVVGRWVIVSAERGRRPSAFGALTVPSEASMCPFCHGNESETPPEIIAHRPGESEPNEKGWSLRVFSNKYPALIVEGELAPEADGLYDRMHGVGAHEVIVDTPEHGIDIADMTIDEVKGFLSAFRERMIDLQRDIRFRYILIFRNYGRAAGASLEHSHSQLIATPIVPKRIAEKIEGAKRYYDYKDRCVYCDIIRQEIADSSRIVSDHDAFISYQPYASRFPFETCIIPKAHQSSFLELTDHDMTLFAESLRDSLRRLKLALNNPPYNFILCTRPVSDESHNHFHWHLEIIPRLTRVAGFEWGTGFYINPTKPEDAARFMRDVDVKNYQPAERKLQRKVVE